MRQSNEMRKLMISNIENFLGDVIMRCVCFTVFSSWKKFHLTDNVICFLFCYFSTHGKHFYSISSTLIKLIRLHYIFLISRLQFSSSFYLFIYFLQMYWSIYSMILYTTILLLLQKQ